MPNSERVLNRKVQVLIKIGPPYFICLDFENFYRGIREGVNLKKFIEILERESKILMRYKRGSPPLRGAPWASRVENELVK